MLLPTRAKALEEERDSLLTVLRIINTESFDQKLSQSSYTKSPPNDNTPSLAEHEQHEFAKQPTAEKHNEGSKRNKPIRDHSFFTGWRGRGGGFSKIIEIFCRTPPISLPIFE